MREAIYKGSTRPAMLFGVPLVAFVLVAGGGLLLAMWLGILLSKWLACAVIAAGGPLLLWMRLATRRDDQRLYQHFIHLRLALRNRNTRFWMSRSYAPLTYRGTQDAFQR